MVKHKMVVCESEDLEVVINELLNDGILEEELEEVLYEIMYVENIEEYDLRFTKLMDDAMDALTNEWDSKNLIELIGTPFLKINPPTGKYFYLET